ncbi:uncharacterized protein LOC130672689 [Microplitis mediator]|uniref:uncharacterized protein LOC130672689 n=1 Tax=Microplitis mediator TaxID=375433 RepID=UPI002557C6A7|nr:uncharacterized protein LOC130672689 [Microplitis mediator]
MRKFPNPPTNAPRASKPRPGNLNSTMMAPGSPKAKTISRRTLMPGGLSTTMASSSLNATICSIPPDDNFVTAMAYADYNFLNLVQKTVTMEGKKRADEIVNQIVSIQMDYDKTCLKLHEYETRIDDVRALTEGLNKIDSEIDSIDCQLDANYDNAMGHLNRINSKLQSANKLICRNIKIYENDEEWELIKSLFKKSNELLNTIMSSSEKFDLTIKIDNNYDEFSNLINSVRKQLIIAHDHLELLQADTIRKMSSYLD